MTEFEQAVTEIDRILNELALPYAVIGGAAVQRWGEPRFTKDIDLVIMAPIEEMTDTIDKLLGLLRPRTPDVREIAQKGRVLLLMASNDYPVDISFGLPGYEEEVIERSSSLRLPSGVEFQVCSAEDLIIYKAVSGRAIDIRDLATVIDREGQTLDIAYIRRWLTIFSNLLENDEVLLRFEKPWKAYESR